MKTKHAITVKNRWTVSIALTSLTLLGSTSSAFAFVGPQPMPHHDQTIRGLHTISIVSSTVDPSNGDQNPYGVAISPKGGLFVSNFSNAAGVNGAGTTIEQIVNGKPVPFFSDANGPAGMAFSPLGPLWIANFGQSSTTGNVQVIKPNGTAFPNGYSVITNPSIQGPWGQAFAGSYTMANGTVVPPAFFVTSVLNGSIEAMYGFSPPKFSTDTKVAVIASGLAHNGTTASNVSGPQGMVWSAKTHTLYVTDSADNSVRAYQWNGPDTINQGTGTIVYQGAPLNMPAGIALNPLNGDLLIVNQGNNQLVELRLNPTMPAPLAHPLNKMPQPPMLLQNGGMLHLPQGPQLAHVVGVRTLDRTPVNPQTGAGSALFGVAASTNADGHLVVYFTDDNTNTLDMLSAGH
ncbi:MAG: hypothetical protein OWR52_01560 [Acidibacillus sp.]|nr:hypothetical protein [Acidibacillus sp.]